MVADLASPRAYAFALLGIHEYFRRLSGDRRVDQVRETLTDRLISLYDQTATDDWPWFEEEASYDNARLSQALIVSGHAAGNERAQEIGLQHAPLAAGSATLASRPLAADRQQRILSARRRVRTI